MRSRHGSICDLQQRCNTPSRNFMFRIFPAVRHVRVARLHSVCLKSRASLRGVLLRNSWLGRGLHIRARGIMNSGSEGCVPYISPLRCFTRMDFQCSHALTAIATSRPVASARTFLQYLLLLLPISKLDGSVCYMAAQCSDHTKFSATRHACRTEETLN